MRKSLRPILAAGAALAMVTCWMAAAPGLSAQAPPAPGVGGRRGPGRGMMMGIPGMPNFGGFGGFAGFGFAGRGRPAGPVTDAPFTATAHIDIATKAGRQRQITAQLARDASGRTSVQVTLPPRPNAGAGGNPGANAGPETVTRIVDPVAHMAYTVFASRKEVVERPLPPPWRAQAPPPPNAHPRLPPNATSKDLGTQTIDGVEANGRQITMHLPARGNRPAGTMTAEVWYAPSLKMVVKASRTSPNGATATYTLENLNQGAPDASLFVPPAGYTVRQAPPPGRGGFGRGFRGGRRGPAGFGGPGGPGGI